MEEIALLRQRIARPPTVFQKIGLVPKPVDPTDLIHPVLGKITEKYFTPLVEIYAKETSASQDIMQVLKRDFANWFEDSIEKLMGTPDQLEFSLAYQVDRRLYPGKLRRFVQEAERIFLGTGDGLPRIVTCEVGISLIARGIQETALSVPLRLYEGEEDVSAATEMCLYETLMEVEKIRRTYFLTDVPNITTSTTLLYRQIALADEYVWLPLKPLITAPLGAAELLLYAREASDAKHLANQIIKSDGVILVTGYRGVGKSTFINQVLSNIQEAQKLQVEDNAWEIIPVQMNVAKAANVGGALRLCIRAIYRTLRQLDEQAGRGERLVSRKEMEHLWFANLRASYKVSMSQAEAFSRAKSLNGEFGFRAGDLGSLLGPLNAVATGLLPTVSYKTSKDWNQKMDRTISLLDYDEDRAEEDILQLISMLAVPRLYKEKWIRVKLVFIFDEMDKMEAKEGQDALIRSLKNLFLTRHAVFLLITSKEFYYMLLEDRKKEDSILGSYFSSVVTVPMFSSANTQRLLMNLLADSAELSGKEQLLIANLARYLTYRAHGLPREIIREIRAMQQWNPRILQPYLADRSLLPGAVQLYALIQEVIENLNGQTETESTEKDDPLMRERIWLNEGRQEQIRRGLYILMEEILNQGSLTLDLSSKFSSYDSNFSTVAYTDFFDVFDQLAHKLAILRLPDDPNTIFFERVESDPTAPQRRAAPAKQTGPAPGRRVSIRVLSSFYSVTGRRITQLEPSVLNGAAQPATAEQVLQQVSELLERDSLFATRRALDYICQHPEVPLPNDVQDKLYKIFVTPGDHAFRIDAGRYLSAEGLYRNSEAASLQTFLRQESNEDLLKQFVDLTAAGATNKTKKAFAYRVLRDLMNRSFTRHNPLPGIVFQNALLEIEKLIVQKKDAEELLNKILATRGLFVQRSLNMEVLGSLFSVVAPSVMAGVAGSTAAALTAAMGATAQQMAADRPAGSDNDETRQGSLLTTKRIIPANIVPALVSLAARAGTNLPLALLEQDTYSLDLEMLNSIVSSFSTEETVTLWKKAMAAKTSSFREALLTVTLLKLAGMLPETSDLLQTWLSDEHWTHADRQVLAAAGKINPKLFYTLERSIGRDRTSRAYQRLQSINVVTVETRKTAATSDSAAERDLRKRRDLQRLAGQSIAAQSDLLTKLLLNRVLPWIVKLTISGITGYSNPWWLNLLLSVGMVVLFFYAPLDMSPDASLWDRISGRSLQFMGMVCSLLALSALALVVNEAEKSNRFTLVAGTLMFLGTSAFIYWNLVRLGYPITVAGELLLTTILFGVVLLPLIVQGIIRLVKGD